jgi:hypothetical protein
MRKEQMVMVRFGIIVAIGMLFIAALFVAGCGTSLGEGKDKLQSALRIESSNFPGKAITDSRDIAAIVGYLDFSDKRRTPCLCLGLVLDFISSDGNKTSINIDAHGWNFAGEEGNIRLLKDPANDNHMAVINDLFKK